MARPTLPRSATRPVRVTVAFSDREVAILKKKARRIGATVSAWVRLATVGRKELP